MILKKQKTISVSKAKKKAWTIFSRYIRLSYANKDGLVSCFTCESWGPWDIWAQCGHFIPGRGNFVLYDERQVRPQCYNCNINLSGNWPVYLVKMTDAHGPEIVSQMILTAKTTVQMKAYQHLEIYEKYKNLFNMEAKKRGIDQ